jgi:hypothetical protein
LLGCVASNNFRSIPYSSIFFHISSSDNLEFKCSPFD